MYVLLFGAFIGIGLWLMVSGTNKGQKGRVWLGGALVLAPMLLIALMAFVSEFLWFEALGFESRFWTFVWTRVGAGLAGAVLASITPLILLRRSGPHLKWAIAGLAAVRRRR